MLSWYKGKHTSVHLSSWCRSKETKWWQTNFYFDHETTCAKEGTFLYFSNLHTQVALKNEPQRQNILCTLGHIQLCIPKMKRLFELGLGLCIGKVCSKWKGLRGFKMAYWLKNVSRDAIPCNDFTKGICCMQPFYLYFSFHGVYSMHEHVYFLAGQVCIYVHTSLYVHHLMTTSASHRW